MNFDFAKTLSLVKGGLTDHQATWKSYLEENPGWQQTAVVLTGPLIVASVLLSVIFSRTIGGFGYLGYHSSFIAAIFWGLVMAVVGFVISVFVFNFLAGIFKGTSNFSRAFAAISLAAIPSWIASVVGALIPWAGFLIMLAGAIMSLVFMYKIMPLALNVPDDKRVVHFVVSLVAIFIINVVIGSIIGAGSVNSYSQRGAFSDNVEKSSSSSRSGVLGEFERQGRLMQSAEEDVYDPPSNGKLKESQVKVYVKVLEKTRAMHEEYARKTQKLSDEIEAKEKAGESISASDLTKMYSGMGVAMSANNAEMEIVKTGQGNWAEHLWIKEQLRIAKIQQGDGTDAIVHNYKLYKKYEDSIDQG
jgi:hypothetical protein